MPKLGNCKLSKDTETDKTHFIILASRKYYKDYSSPILPLPNYLIAFSSYDIKLCACEKLRKSKLPC